MNWVINNSSKIIEALVKDLNLELGVQDVKMKKPGTKRCKVEGVGKKTGCC
jgi:hypothetical protein